MRKVKSTISILLAVMMLFSTLTFAVSAAKIIDRGKCGTNAYWTLDSEGTFTVRGKGEMWDGYGYNFESLDRVVIENGITKIGSLAFSSCYNLKSVEMPNSLTKIGSEAFEACNSLTSITIPNGVTNIDSDAFSGCRSLKNITIPSSVTYIGYNAFSGCDNLKDVYYTGTEKQWKEIDIRYVNEGNYCLVSANIHFKCDHTFGSWTITKQPTYTAAGTQTRKCTKCGTTETKTIAKKKTTAISKCTFSTLKPVTYTGKAISPKLTVKNGKTTLKAGTHYAVSYKNNTKVGKATVTIKGVEKNGYTGSKTLTFNILPGVTKSIKAAQSTSAVKLTWSKVAGASGYRIFRHDGKKWVKVADTKNTTYTVSKLKTGTGYKFAVKAYTKAGSAVYWSESYAQIATATKPATPTLKVATASKSAKLSWNKVTGASGYAVYYSTSKDGTYKRLATVKGTAYTASKLTTGKAYYFKVAAYKTVSKTNIYSSYSAVKGVKVK